MHHPPLLALLALLPLLLAHPTASTSLYLQLESLQSNLTALHSTLAPSWVSAPNIRGTNSILYSCLLTLFACIYTALHLNIPARGSGRWRLLRDKCAWGFAALIGPEVVLYYASSQFLEARWLARDLRRVLGDEEGLLWKGQEEGVQMAEEGAQPKGGERQAGDWRFNLKYGFFVVMGGLEMWHRAPGGSPVLRTLSPSGIRKLAAANLAPLKIPLSTIEDRSKADTIQKGLVLLQVAWMALQCITRKALGLPLTLLELHTMVHVVCAFIMYAFWFEKPLDVRNAELVDHADFGDVALDEHTDFYPRRGNMPEYKLEWVLRGNVKEIFGSSDSLLVALLFVLPLLYGGVHLSAWGFEFPTAAEDVCWKAACVFIALALVMWCLVHWVCMFAELVLLHLCGLDVEYLTDLNLIVTGRIFFFVCVVCRLYIVIEAFVGLRAVPIGVYWTPSWIQMIPHV